MDKSMAMDFGGEAAPEAARSFSDRLQTFVRSPIKSLLGDVAALPVGGANLPVSVRAPSASRQLARQAGVDDFLRQVRSTAAPSGRGRLIFGMDATASREPTWRRACEIQGEMFRSTAAIGGIEVQLAYYRGLCDFTASPWIKDPEPLLERMRAVQCLTGETQIRRILKHGLKEHGKSRVSAVVFVGDCVEESTDQLLALATEAGVTKLPIFVFQEGGDEKAKEAFEEMARVSGGAYCAFDGKSASQLKELLSAVAVYAAGGHRALADYSRDRCDTVRLLTNQMGMAFRGA